MTSSRARRSSRSTTTRPTGARRSSRSSCYPGSTAFRTSRSPLPTQATSNRRNGGRSARSSLTGCSSAPGRFHAGGHPYSAALRHPGQPHRGRRLGQLGGRRDSSGRCRQGLSGAHALPGRNGLRDPQALEAIHHRQGKSDLRDTRKFGSVYYNSGLIDAVISVELVRKAQEKFGKRPVTGEEGQWGLENLNIDNARLKANGFHGLLQPLRLSARDHEGGGAVKVQQWDGKKWNQVSDWIRPTANCCGRSSRPSLPPTPRKRHHTPRSVARKELSHEQRHRQRHSG